MSQQRIPPPPHQVPKPLGSPITEREAVAALMDAGFSLDQVYEFMRRGRG